MQTFPLFFSKGRRREHTREAVVSFPTCRTDMLEFTHSSLRCTLLRRLVYRRHPSYSPCRLLLNSRRVLLHIRFCRCTSSVSDFPPFSLMLLVGVTAGYNSIRLLVPSPSTTHFSRHTSLFGVRFWSDGVSERYA